MVVCSLMRRSRPGTTAIIRSVLPALPVRLSWHTTQCMMGMITTFTASSATIGSLPRWDTGELAVLTGWMGTPTQCWGTPSRPSNQCSAVSTPSRPSNHSVLSNTQSTRSILTYTLLEIRKIKYQMYAEITPLILLNSPSNRVFYIMLQNIVFVNYYMCKLSLY